MVEYNGISKRLRALSKVKTFEIDPVQFVANIDNESDRGAVILAVTAIDDALQIRLQEHLKAETKAEYNDLFGPRGIVGSFGARTMLAKSLGIIESGVAETIDLLRLARNACAHAQNDLSFHSQELIDLIDYFSIGQSTPAAEVHVLIRKHVFAVSCIFLANAVRLGASSSDAFAEAQAMIVPLMEATSQKLANLSVHIEPGGEE